MSNASIPAACLLAVAAVNTLLPVPAVAQVGEPRPRLFLDVALISSPPAGDLRGGSLTRELVRQAVLMAARDELGFATADATLDEALPSSPPPGSMTLQIVVTTAAGGKLLLNLSLVDGPVQQLILRKEYSYNQDARHIYESLPRVLEAEVRTTFAETIKAAAGRLPYAGDSQEPDLARVGTLQTEMNLVSQFVAVRLAHEQLRRAPKSAETLGALARGYANLAMLTQEHWDAGPHAFAARALLYAERQVATANEAPTATADRIYVRALVGLHELALRGVARLRDQGVLGDMPPWLSLVEAYCRFDRQALAPSASNDSSLVQLRAILNARVANAVGDERILLESTDEALNVAPEASVLYPPLTTVGSLGTKRVAAAGALRRLSRRLPARVGQTPELPEQVRKLSAEIDKDRNEELEVFFSPGLRKLADSLVEAGQSDEGEPSWSALAGLIKEDLFVSTAWYLEVVDGGVAMSMADEAIAARALVDGHRYASYIASFEFDKDTQWNQFVNAVRPLQIVDMRPSMRRMFSHVWNVDLPGRFHIGQAAFDDAIRQRAFTADDMGQVIRLADPARDTNSVVKNNWDMLLGQLAKISPHHPVVIRTTIAATKDPTAEQLAAWEVAAQGDPLTVLALGDKYFHLKQFDAAVRCAENSIELTHERAAYEALAKARRGQGREDLWLAALEAFLEIEDPGLGHAQIRDRIAVDFLERGEYERAKPYAVAAASSGAAWALTTASEVCERLEQWNESENYIRHVSQSYDKASRLAWYRWCRRTERGDATAALELGKQYIESPRSENDFYGPDSRLVYFLLAERPAEALASARMSADRNSNDYWALVHSALLAVELKNGETTNDSLSKLAQLTSLDDKSKERPDRQALEFIIDQLGAAPQQTPTKETLDACLDAVEPELRASLGYFLGRTCELTGRSEMATHCYRRTLGECRLQTFNVTLAAVRLQEIEGGK